MRWPRWICLVGVVLCFSVSVFGVPLGGSPVFAQESDVAVEVTAPAMGEPTQSQLATFRSALLKASAEAVKKGELSRLDAFRLRVASANPSALKRMHQCCAEQVLTDGKAASFAAIDWNALLSFIKELIPIILELIKLFTWLPNPSTCGPQVAMAFGPADTLCLSLAA